MLLLLIAGIAFAQEFSSYQITLSIGDTIQEEFAFSMNNTYQGPLDEISMYLATEPRNIQVEPNARYTVEKASKGYIFKILLDKPVPEGEILNAKVSLETDSWAEPINDGELFSYRYTPEAGIKDLTLTIKLPKASAISLQPQGAQTAAVSPIPDSITTDGERTILSWKMRDVKEGEQVSVMAVYSMSQSYKALYFLSGGLLGALAIFAYMRRKDQERKEKIVSKVVPLALSADEKVLYDILKEGETTQEELRKRTGHSKSKISKLVRNLEVKHLVKKTPYRKTNKLKLRKI